MKCMLLVLLLCTPIFVQALDLRVGTAGAKHTHGITWVLEHQINDKWYGSLAYLNHPYSDPWKVRIPSRMSRNQEAQVEQQGILTVQRQWGNKFYYRAGPGFVTRTGRNHWMNLCMSAGVALGAIDLAIMHCSNGGLWRPNSGTDTITIRITR